jgi:hypothetical protein
MPRRRASAGTENPYFSFGRCERRFGACLPSMVREAADKASCVAESAQISEDAQRATSQEGLGLERPSNGALRD